MEHILHEWFEVNVRVVVIINVEGKSYRHVTEGKRIMTGMSLRWLLNHTQMG